MSIPVQAHPNFLASSRTLVVGGTSGIGAAVVSAILANGGRVHVCSSNPERIAAKIGEFRALYPDAAPVTGTAANLADEDSLEHNVTRILDEAIQALGGVLDHVVYTAGDGFRPSPLTAVDAKTFFKGWNVRYLGPLILAKVIKSNPGTYLTVDVASSITYTSGILSHKPVPGAAHFVGWAGALETTARGLAIDLAPVRVNVVSPGAIYTEMLAGLSDAGKRRFDEGTLRKKVGSPAECAEGYLLCMRSAFVSGEIVKVHGGAELV